MSGTVFSNRTVFVILFVLSVIFYGNTINNGFSLDDNYIFQQIPQEGSDFVSCFKVFTQRYDFQDYRPVAMFTYALEQWLLGKIYPSFSHAINVGLYFLLSFSIFFLIKNLPEKQARTLAFITALLFLAHPIHANIVSNLKSRDTILGMLSGVWSIYFFTFHQPALQRNKIIGFASGVVLLLIALNTKSDNLNILIIVPFTIVFYRLIPIRKMVYGMIFIFILLISQSLFLQDAVPVEASQGNAILFTENPIVEQWNIPYRLSQAITSYGWYLKFMLIPGNYFFYYGYDTSQLYPIFHIVPILLLIIHLGILYLAYRLYKTEERTATYAILFFYATLFYCCNFYIPVAGIIADRYAFIASLGFCLLLAWAIMKAGNYLYSYAGKQMQLKAPKNKKTPASSHLSPLVFTLVIAGIISAIYLPFTWERNRAWKDILTLMDKDIPHLKKSFQANRIAVTHYLNAARTEQRPDSARVLYTKALDCANNANNVYANDIFILESKGLSYLGLGNRDAAFMTFVMINNRTDSSLLTYNMLGDMFYQRRSFDTATYFYHRTVALDTLTDAGYYKLITTLHALGRQQGAMQFCDSIIQRRPTFSISYESKGWAYLNMGDTSNAGRYYLKAMQLGLQSPPFANMFRDYHLTHQDIPAAKQFEPYLAP